MSTTCARRLLRRDAGAVAVWSPGLRRRRVRLAEHQRDVQFRAHGRWTVDVLSALLASKLDGELTISNHASAQAASQAS